jgi:hypothetical protein
VKWSKKEKRVKVKKSKTKPGKEQQEAIRGDFGYK